MKKFITLFAIILLCSGFVKANDSQSPDYYSKIKNSGTFIENKGQWPDHVKFLTKLNGMNCWITDLGIIYDYYRIELARVFDRNQTLLRKTQYVFFPAEN